MLNSPVVAISFIVNSSISIISNGSSSSSSNSSGSSSSEGVVIVVVVVVAISCSGESQPFTNPWQTRDESVTS